MSPSIERRRRIVIMGAAGRDFHNFNVAFRGDPAVEVVAFTATQIPGIGGRTYPEPLAGPLYPKGIPIVDESELVDLVRDRDVDEVIFAYSDVSHTHVMHAASKALAAGADFRIMGPRATMLDSLVPVVAVCAARTGAGKSQTTRRVIGLLRDAGRRPVVVRHPMPYGDLASARAQRFASFEDLDGANITVEEREEYEPHVEAGTVVFAGVDYGEILHRAETEGDVIVWDGGNNDLPFYRPDLHIVVVDPLRAGHERNYHPGEANVRMADVVVINKIDAAEPARVADVEESVRELNPGATVVRARSPITVSGEETIKGKRVLVVEDGPTLTHGDMSFGAGIVAARRHGAAEFVDPRPFAAGSLREVYERFPAIGPLLPAMGYSPEQVGELAETINRSDADLVVLATPVDLRRIAPIRKPAVRVTYELAEEGRPTLADALAPMLERAAEAERA